MAVSEIVSLWPIFLGFITLVVILSRMFISIEVLQEKVKTIFSIINEKLK